MNKYKVCVYAICKNEEKFVDRWYESMKEADEIYVLDTGSNDKTVELLQSYGVNVKIKMFENWRFDVARNESMKMIPDDVDICVCTDLDEEFKIGWRDEIERVWRDDTNRLRYIYNWSLDNDDKPIVSFYYEKIHSRKGYEWINPVHEVLQYNGKDENVIVNNEIVLNHYPDNTKSRSSYLKLLELSVLENPKNDRNMHYLGREYMYYEKWNECIDTLICHLSLSTALWKDERSASMRFIARSYKNLGRIEEARMWLDKAMNETPYLRDAFIERALLEYDLGNYEDVEYFCRKALEISNNEMTYINEVFSWDNTVYDLLSISCFNLNKIEDSLYFVNKAIEMKPNNERLLNNKVLIENYLKKFS